MSSPADPSKLESAALATLAPASAPAPASAARRPENSWTEPSPFSREGRPLLGPSLRLFGAGLWAYVVVGELVINVGLSESLAWVTLLAVVGLSWQSSVRHIPRGEARRRFEPLVAGLVLAFLTLLFSALFLGTRHQSQAEAVTIALWVLSLIAYFLGRYFSAAPRVRVSGLTRAGTISAWVVTAVATAVALVVAMSRM